MRAAVLHTPGEAPVHGTHPDPDPAPGRTVVAVTAAPLVPLDLLLQALPTPSEHCQSIAQSITIRVSIERSLSMGELRSRCIPARPRWRYGF